MNYLRQELKGKVVSILPKYLPEGVIDNRFLCEGGFGCSPNTNGETIYGKWLQDGESGAIGGRMVDKLVEEKE